jgi:hypothetical protein
VFAGDVLEQGVPANLRYARSRGGGFNDREHLVELVI